MILCISLCSSSNLNSGLEDFELVYGQELQREKHLHLHIYSTSSSQPLEKDYTLESSSSFPKLFINPLQNYIVEFVLFERVRLCA